MTRTLFGDEPEPVPEPAGKPHGKRRVGGPDGPGAGYGRAPSGPSAPYDREADRQANILASEKARVRRCETWGVDPSDPNHEKLIEAARLRHQHDPAVVAAADARIAANIARYAARKASPKPPKRAAQIARGSGATAPRADHTAFDD